MLRIQDPLYGEIGFAAPLARLIATPAVQRLRRVRLSNIDSLDTPAIAGVSRYEHVLGTCYLGHQVGFFRQLLTEDALTLTAACLLHDIAITPFGHLLEEALGYAGIKYSHEAKMSGLFAQNEAHELGGIELQIYEHAVSGISDWAKYAFDVAHAERLNDVLKAALGRGPWGPCISGAIDLDNLDNIGRLAHHMGLPARRDLAVQLASRIVTTDGASVVWKADSAELLTEWIELRHRLYSRLMLSRRDFVGKTMLTAAIVRGLENSQLGTRGYEWTLTDDELIGRLRDPGCPQATDRRVAQWIAETIRRWNLGQLWNSTPLFWVSGPMPLRPAVWSFGQRCSNELSRECFAHGIPDKRHREVNVTLESGETCRFGHPATQWLLGVATPTKAAMTKNDTVVVSRLAREYFAVDVREVESGVSSTTAAVSLFDIV